MECAATPHHGAAIAMPETRRVVCEISLRADRSSRHSFSPISFQPRAATKSSTLCFLVTDRTLVLGDGRVVLDQRLGEIVSARSVGLRDEVKVVAFGGGERRPDRAEPRIGNRSRRQAGMPIRVPGGFALKVGTMDSSPVSVLQQSCVNGGGDATEFN